MKKYKVKHRYKWWQFIKIIKRHLYIKIPLEDYINRVGEKCEKEIHEKQLELMINGHSKF